jgi:hypothetical protein
VSEQVSIYIICTFAGLVIGLLVKVFEKRHVPPCVELALLKQEQEKQEKAINEQWDRLRSVEQAQAASNNDTVWVRQILSEIRQDIKELKAKANE